MNYQETEEYLHNLPVFQPDKVVKGEQTFNLDSIRLLLAKLGNPEKKLHYVHIGGTNGKGSTAAFLREILTTAGYHVGTYISPEIRSLTERIRIDGVDISEEDFAWAMTLVKEKVDEMHQEQSGYPSEFEIVISAAFLYFVKKEVDLVLLEVGLGGDTDATNVIPTPELAIITTISFDHMSLLGHTLAEIAGHKAGIIKDQGLVLTYPQEEEVTTVLKDKCSQVGAKLYQAGLPDRAESYSMEGQSFAIDGRMECLYENETFGQESKTGLDDGISISYKDLQISLLGTYQINNASMAVQAACLLREERGYEISDDHIRQGLAKTQWPVRFQLLGKKPYVIADGGHNLQGIQVLRDSLDRLFPGKKIRFVTGVLKDKEYDKMMSVILPMADRFYTITPPNPRALQADELADYLTGLGTFAKAYESVEDAVSIAVKEAGEDDVVCVFGSLYFVGQVEDILKGLDIN